MVSKKQPLQVVRDQVKAAKPELDSYPPAGFGWYKRSLNTANELVPWLTEVAPQLKVYVEEVVNSKQLVRETWKQVRAAASDRIPRRLLALMERELDREAILLEVVGGNVMSKVIEKFLIQNFPDAHLVSNGSSDYPDLFLQSRDYSQLPVFTRLKDKSLDYGAALKGKTKRPVRIPDGLEVKPARTVCMSTAIMRMRDCTWLWYITAAKAIYRSLIFSWRSCDMRITGLRSPLLRRRRLKRRSMAQTLSVCWDERR